MSLINKHSINQNDLYQQQRRYEWQFTHAQHHKSLGLVPNAQLHSGWLSDWDENSFCNACVAVV